MPYLDYQPQPLVLPPWMAGPWGTAWGQATGLLKDSFADGVTQATKVRFISQCPEDALAYHGAARGWPRAPGETAAEYRKRLAAAWSLAAEVGTARGMIDAFASVGMTGVSVMENKDWARSGDTTLSRWFWPIIRQPHPFGTDFSFRYGDGTTWGGGKQWGVTGDPRWFELVRFLVRKMQPAHAHCAEIILVLAGDIKTGTATTADGDPLNAASRVAYLNPISVYTP